MSDDEEIMNEKYGTPLPYDRNFRGPQWRSRSCTDIPCLIIFALFLGAWVFIAYYAIKNGDLNKLIAPTDYLNRKCGVDSQVLDKKYLFFFDLDKCLDPVVPLTGCPTTQVCVSECPKVDFNWENNKDSMSIAVLKSHLICRSQSDLDKILKIIDIQHAIKDQRCVGSYVKSEPFLNRCVPEACASTPAVNGSPVSTYNSKSSLPEELSRQCNSNDDSVIKQKMLQTSTSINKLVVNIVARFLPNTHDVQVIGEAIAKDIFESCWIVLTALLLTLVASLLFIVLLRWLAGPILWLSICGVLLGLAAGLYYSINEYIFWHNTPTKPYQATNLHAAVKNVLQEEKTWLGLSIFIGVCFVVILLLIIVLRKRISIAIALTKEGSKAVSCVKSTIFFPIFSWVLYLLVIIYAVLIGLYLSSTGESDFRMIKQLYPNRASGVTSELCVCEPPVQHYKVGESCEPVLFEEHCFKLGARSPCLETRCSFLGINNPPMVNLFIGCNIFGFFWVMFFIAAFNDMVLAATFATWYWTFKKSNVPFFTLTRAFSQCAFYHMGTLAFGSLILAICRIIRLILEYVNKKLKNYDNAVVKAIMCCCRCFFWLLETFLNFLNRNAYIMCAIHGKNFCGSAKDAFNLIMRNCLRVVAVDKVTDFIFFLSKVLLAGAAGVGTYYFCVNNPKMIHITYIEVPTTIVVIAAFLMTNVIFGVYSMAVDTLFLCFLEDCERNDGTPEKPYFMSRQLMRILGKRNVRPVKYESD